MFNGQNDENAKKIAQSYTGFLKIWEKAYICPLP
jgi:hypothetical protein